MRIRKNCKVGGTFAQWTIDAPSNEDIDADNDGVMSTKHQFEIDLSHVASYVLGRQASMMASYRLHSIRVGIRPVDDLTDNAHQTAFAGTLWWTTPTDHVKTGLQLARKMENASESFQYDGDSFFLSDDKDYSGYRYSAYLDGATLYQTNSSITGWNHLLSNIRAAYNKMTEPNQTNALFGGRFGGEASLMWNCSWSTGMNQNPLIQGDDTHDLNHLALPVLRGAVEFSSGDEPGTVDDDYELWIDVDFTPEVEVF